MKVGSIVECIDNSGFDNVVGNMNELPVKGKIYTIRGIEKYGGIVGVYLEEIVNPKMQYIDGYGELNFKIERFKELLPPMVISIESILEEVNV